MLLLSQRLREGACQGRSAQRLMCKTKCQTIQTEYLSCCQYLLLHFQYFSNRIAPHHSTQSQSCHQSRPTQNTSEMAAVLEKLP